MPQLIKDGAIVEDRWTLWREQPTGALPPEVPAIVPLSWWIAQRSALFARSELGVWLAPDADPQALADDIGSLPLIAVDFPQLGDGRGYSIARLLRSQYGFSGELRAIGDVLRDQLFYLGQCGFNAFAVRAERNLEDALRGLRDFSDSYQATAATPLPLFRRRIALPVPGDPTERA